MNTPHERLTRTTFSLPLGEVHALVGGALNARPLLFLHGFPDHPATAARSSSTSPRSTGSSRHGCAATLPLRSSVPTTLTPSPPTPPDRSPRRSGGTRRPRLGRCDHLHCVRRRAVARPSRGHACDPAPGHLAALARLLEAVEEELVYGPFPAPRSRLSRASPQARPDRSPAARLVAELHARLRAPSRAARLSRAQPPHRSSTTARSCARSRHSSIACAGSRRTLQRRCCSSMAATTAASCRRSTRTVGCSMRVSSRSCRTLVTSCTSRLPTIA